MPEHQGWWSRAGLEKELCIFCCTTISNPPFCYTLQINITVHEPKKQQFTKDNEKEKTTCEDHTTLSLSKFGPWNPVLSFSLSLWHHCLLGLCTVICISWVQQHGCWILWCHKICTSDARAAMHRCRQGGYITRYKFTPYQKCFD